MRRALALFTALCPLLAAAADDGDAALAAALAQDHAYLRALYEDLHRHPELHDQEQWTGARMADELGKAGFKVIDGLGGHGRVGVLENGAGPVLMIRTIMDALPIAENTGLPFASKATAKAEDGTAVPVSHVCGHDAIMTVGIGAARYLAAHRHAWRGTLVVVTQPADESILGARKMIKDGFVKAVPKPDFILAYHVLPDYRSDHVAWVKGDVLAGSETAEIVVRGVPGHASFPSDAKDPVPLAAETVLALQTFMAREIPPLEDATLNIGSIHGGQEVSAIPAEVKLGLSMSFYGETVRDLLRTRIPQIAEHLARAHGMPDDRLPLVSFAPNGTSSTYNDPALTTRAAAGFTRALGAAQVIEGKPLIGTDETVEFSKAYTPAVPMMFFYVGSSAPKALEAARTGGAALPSLHAPEYAPDADASLRTGALALIGAARELLPP